MIFEKAIVSYVDILGYKDLVERVIGKPELVERMEALFYGLSVDTLRKMGEIDLEDVAKESDAEIQEYFKRVVGTIRVRCIADSFIFTLPVSSINFFCRKYDLKTTVGNCIETYFAAMTLCATFFIAKMGHVLRGGISIGNHYESEKENQLFVFSEAHNRAVTLEEEKAENPRIVLDELLLQYLQEISYPNIDKFFYKDVDGYYCLDIYSTLHTWDIKDKILEDIKKGLIISMNHNFNNASVLDKLLNFARYHNRKVNSAKVSLPYLAFDISKYEEQLQRLKKNS